MCAQITEEFIFPCWRNKTWKEFCFFTRQARFMYWKCMIVIYFLLHCCLQRRVLIQHQVNCLWKLNCFGFICWSCQSLALLYPTQCCLYLYHWWLHKELLSSFKYGCKRIWEVLESTEELDLHASPKHGASWLLLLISLLFS